MHLSINKFYFVTLGKVFGFVSATLFFFYLAMILSVDGYVFDLVYFIVNALFLAVCVEALFFLPGPTRFYLLVAYLMMVVPTVIVSSYIMIYKTYFGNEAFFFIWDSNPQEISEFLSDCFRRFPDLLSWSSACFFVPLVFLMPLWSARKQLRYINLRTRTTLALAWGILAFLLGNGPMLYFNYTLNFYKSYVKYHSDLNTVLRVSRLNREKSFSEDFASLCPSDQETYVVVIGESAGRHHMSIYGYPRETDPMMKKRKAQGDLFAFANVNATADGTMYSLLQALSFIDQRTSVDEFSYSVVDVFNAANFKTFWLSNNALFLQYDTLLQTLSNNASVRRFIRATDLDFWSMQRGKDFSLEETENLVYDEVLLSLLDKALQDPSPKKIIFLHFKGSHLRYKYRYPVQFDKFVNSEDLPPRSFALKEEHLWLINEYDNSILYTDYLLEKVIDRLEKKKEKSWMLYFSDHGEEVYDFREFNGRSRPFSKFVFDVPFFVWLSPKYKETRDVSQWHQYLNRPFRLDDLIHVLLDLGNIRTRYLDLSRSLLSERYIMRARGVFDSFYLDFPPLDLYNVETYEEEKELNRKWTRGEGTL